MKSFAAFKLFVSSVIVMLISGVMGITSAKAQVSGPCTTANTVIANVASIDQAWVWNRYGALQPHGMMFALMRDIRVLDPTVKSGQRPLNVGESFSPGNVALRLDKRPRPLVLRVNKGSCLEIRFTNLLDPNRRNQFKLAQPPHFRCDPLPTGARPEGCGEQPADRWSGLHVTGLAPDTTITQMAQHVGGNPSSLVPPGSSITYRLRAEEEGTFFAYSPAATSGSDGNGGSIHAGLFAAVNVEPTGSVWYRSQVSEAQMPVITTTGPIFKNSNYAAYAMLQGNEIIHSDINAIIDMRTATVSSEFLCLDPAGKPYPVCGDRKKSFREFTTIFHDESGAIQAFKEFDAPETATDAEKAFAKSLGSTRDGFAINYGTAGIGAENLATRKKVGPTKNCIECQLEEFFLSSWVVGDPAMIVDKPANMQIPNAPFAGQSATRTFFPDDPSNVYHSYLNDRVIIRNIHAGPKEHHAFHLHAHQWLQVQAKPESAYLDSQTIGPGGAYSYEIAYGGSGNLNRSPGDSIFHCHFYPHFAQGMWSLWRVHDVFERGSKLDASGVVAIGARALPDGEIARGTPIPGLIPLPDMPLLPNPGPVKIVNGQIDIASMDNPTSATYRHPGYPFYVPAKAGRRPPTPPKDVIHDGGLHRHIVNGGAVVDRALPPSFVRDYNSLAVTYLPEGGTPHEMRAFDFHAKNHATVTPGGVAATFVTNGRPAIEGAPFADPCPAGVTTRTFQAAAFQYDMIFTKKGWHTPQARILALREDVLPTLTGDRLPQPFFFRVNSGQCINYQHSNVVPREYRLDAFQFNVPTDIIGQHIHLVKFDVQASDGGANGFNYEDGTPAAEDVVERIRAIRIGNNCNPGVTDPATLLAFAKRGVGDTRVGTDACPIAEPHPWYPNKPEWIGGQVTMQRWYADPQQAPDWRGATSAQIAARTPTKSFDKTLETVFTHDHFGASTHQQVGLYAGLIVEPAATRWFDHDNNGNLMELGAGNRKDGGPTSWKSVVIGATAADTFREFALNYQDFHIAYSPSPDSRVGNPLNNPWQVADAADNDYTGTSLPKLVNQECPPNPTGVCWPEVVSADDIGVMSINYRAEPIPPRIWNSLNKTTQAAGNQGDLSHMFRSITRNDPDLNRQQDNFPLVGNISKPSWPVPTPGMTARDPFTPLLETYEREPFRIRLLAGAHEHEHSFTVNGMAWKHTLSDPNSGYKSFQGTALSEHFEFDGTLDIPSSLYNPLTGTTPRFTQLDHLYKIGASIEDVWYGNWGLLRAYREGKTQPPYLPTIDRVTHFASGLVGGPAPVTLSSPQSLTNAALAALAVTDTNQYEPIDQIQLASLLNSASTLEKQLVSEANARGIVIGASAPPSVSSGTTRFTAADGSTTDGVARIDGTPLPTGDPYVFETDGAAVAANLPPPSSDPVAIAPLANRSSQLATVAGSTLTSTADPNSEAYQNAVLEAEYEDLIEGLRAFRLAAGSFVNRIDRQPAVAPAKRIAFDNAAKSAPVATLDFPSAKARFTSLRDSLPLIIDLRDPQSLPVCPAYAPVRYNWVLAVDVKSRLRDQTLVYHRFKPGTSYGVSTSMVERWQDVHDPSGLIYMRLADLDITGKYRADRKVEPLILNARAGDCIVTMFSNVITQISDPDTFSTLPNIASNFNFNELNTSNAVGLHAQTVRKHVGTQDGMNVGTNAVQTITPGQSKYFIWYAGVIDYNGTTPTYKPVEFGGLNIMPADPIRQGGKGLIGALIVQPQSSFWGFDFTAPEPFSAITTPLRTRASAYVTNADGTGYRDFALIGQNDANFRLRGDRVQSAWKYPGLGSTSPNGILSIGAELAKQLADHPFPSLSDATGGVTTPGRFDLPVRRVAMCAEGGAICPVKDEEVDAVEMGHKAFNYRSEAGWMRRIHSAAMPLSTIALLQQRDQLSDAFLGLNASNQTPRFCARPGDAVRLRLLLPNGHGRNHTMDVQGHNFDEQPFVNQSASLGTDELSQYRGTRDVLGPGAAFNILLANGAGGSGRVAGDYAIRDLYSWGYDNGMWATLRVNTTCW
jgi:manganese oxidase